MIQIILIGFIVGVCISYSGVGAGSLTTPLIVLFLGYDASTAIGSDLLFSLGTKIVAFLTHIRAQTVNYGALLFLSLGGVPGAIVGVLITGWLHAHFPLPAVNHVLKIALGVALLIAAAAVAFTRSVAPDTHPPERPLPHLPLTLTGFVVGTLVSITSIGSGSLTLPLLLLVLSQAQLRTLVGTDVAFAVVLLVPAIIGHFKLGDVNIRLAMLLLAGSIPGVLVGTPLAKRLPERAFRVGLALILLIVGVRMFY
ncbi:MAG TPA: sulfite exporter TauE/SafE family protein [Candidatus Baltobacteraceae bacterium]|nr:sulfite exporter TauE/SafE family protein [Candidatus Baltobacteraceae bacterium]